MMVKSRSTFWALIPFSAGYLLGLSGCSTPADKKVNLDIAVATANDAIAKTHASGKFEAERVEIAEESEKHTTNRCLMESWDDVPPSARVQALRQKLAGRKYYVIRYPLPAPYRDPEAGLLEWNGWEDCVFIDRTTGEVLGVVS